MKAKTELKQTEPMTDNEITKYRNMLRMTVIVSLVLFFAWFIFHGNFWMTFAATFLCLLPVADSSKMMKAKKEMIEHGMQKGNIVGCAFLSTTDMILWALSLIRMFIK